MTNLYWWRDQAPIDQGESDGQQMTWTYARQVDGVWEYVIVQLSDGDGPEYTFGGVYLREGQVIRIPSDSDRS